MSEEAPGAARPAADRKTRNIAQMLADPRTVARALPYVLTAVYLLIRDAGVALLAVAAASFVLAGATWALDSALGHAASFVCARPRAQKIAQILAWTVWAGLPCLFALDAFRQAGDELGARTPALALGATAALIGASWAAERFGAWRGSSRAAMFVLGLPMLALFAWLVDASGVLMSVRPGTELEHLALFAGAWSLSVLASAIEGHARCGAEQPRPPARWLGLASLAVGLVLLEADRRALVDQYPELHLWMAVQGFVFIRIALAGLLGDRLDARPVIGKVALAVLVVAAIASALKLPSYANIQARGRLADSAIGRSLLFVIPPAQVKRGGDGSELPPELAYPRFLDERSPLDRPNILLVTVDALRGDIYEHAPRLEAFSTRSLRFDHAYAQGSRTAIGMGALLTGRYSANIDWDLWVYEKGNIYPRSKLSEQAKQGKRKYVHTTIPMLPAGDMLAERIHARGYTTVAVPFAGHNEFFRAGVGFDRGFDTFIDLTHEDWKPPSSPNITERVLAELARVEGRDAPWFVWTHFYDPHESGGKRQRYDELIGDFDRGFGQLIDHLEATGQLDNTIVAVVADHGEALGEHGHKSHATSLFDDQTRVPLVLWVPGMQGANIELPVAAIDLSATLLVLAGANTERIDGTNLLAMGRGEPEAMIERPVFSELHRYMSSKGARTSDLKSVRLGKWKLIHDRTKGTIALYDIDSDPDEAVDRIADEPDVGARLQGILDAFLAAAEAEHPLP